MNENTYVFNQQPVEQTQEELPSYSNYYNHKPRKSAWPFIIILLLIAGVVVVKDNQELIERIGFLQNAMGAILSPFDSFLILRGLKTLSIRMKAHSENAQKIANYLEEHPKVDKVIYPGLESHHEPGLRLGHPVERSSIDTLPVFPQNHE